VQGPMPCFALDGKESSENHVAIKQTSITYADQIALLAIDQHR
jgi:hypothetical protein